MKDKTMLDIGVARRTAELAKLDFSEAEMSGLLRDMNDMVDFASKLTEAHIEGVEPMEHVVPLRNVFREDISEREYAREELIAASANVSDGYITVPKVIGE